MHDPTRAARCERRRDENAARTDGSVTSVRDARMRRVGFTDRTRVADRKTTGDRVFSIDESVIGDLGHTRVRWIAPDTFATIERPTPNVRRIASDAANDLAVKRKTARATAADRGLRLKRGRKATTSGNAEAGQVRRPAAFGTSARRG